MHQPSHEFKNRPFRQRLGFALAGIRAVWRLENSFRAQVALAAGAILLFALLGVGPLWWALAVLCIGLVLAGELANSAVEALVDHLHPEQHPEIGKVKDMLAGMVLVLSIVAALVALLAVVSVCLYTSRDQEYPIHGARLFADSCVAKT